jgi:hypothetical protein
VRQGNKLDWAYIFKHLNELAALKDCPQIPDRLKKLRSESES